MDQQDLRSVKALERIAAALEALFALIQAEIMKDEARTAKIQADVDAQPGDTRIANGASWDGVG